MLQRKLLLLWQLLLHCKTMKNDIEERINEIQASMMESAKSCFTKSELSHLYYLITVTGKFFNYLQTSTANLQSDLELRYTMETVFNGVDSFCSVSAAYRILVGATSSTISWDEVSVPTFNEQFTSKFHEFTAESKFEKQCRLLLDLFKLEIVLAGLLYD